MKHFNNFLITLLLLVAVFTTEVKAQTNPLDYDVIYVRYPVFTGDYAGERTLSFIPQGERAYVIKGGADLMLLKADGSEVVLVDCDSTCSVMDTFMSYDGTTVYYSEIQSIVEDNAGNKGTPGYLFKIDLTDENYTPVQLTFNDGFKSLLYAGNTTSSDDHGSYRSIRDMAPVPLSDGRLLFTSNRAGLIALDSDTDEVVDGSIQELFVMDDHDGTANTAELANIRKLDEGALQLVQHPLQLHDGRIVFSTWQSVGAKYRYAMTSLFTIHPDGTNLQQFSEPHHQQKHLDHFVTQLPNDDVVVGVYYPSYDYGYGVLHRMPVGVSGPDFLRGSIFQQDTFTGGFSTSERRFDRRGTTNMTPHTRASDVPAPDRSGKYSMPSATSDGNMLVAYSTGYVNYFTSACQAFTPNRCEGLKSGIYMIRNATNAIIKDPADLVLIKDDPNYNEIWPRAVLPYSQIHGIEKPAILPMDRSNTNNATAIMGTSSMINREPAPDTETFIEGDREQDGGNWTIQGADAGVYTNADIFGVRILGTPHKPFTEPLCGSALAALHPNIDNLLTDTRNDCSVSRYASTHFEKWEVLGEFPLAHKATTDAQGNPDTSWASIVPADTPLLIQAIDDKGMTLNSELTWRGLKAGEERLDCGGCHAHSIDPLSYATTQSGQRAPIQSITGLLDTDARIQNGIWNLTSGSIPLIDDSGSTAFINEPHLGVEFNRDVEPIITNTCAGCHNGTQYPDFTGTGITLWEKVARDVSDATWNNYPQMPLNKKGGRLQPSPFVRKMQARGSLLTWMFYNERLDGRTNATWADDIDYPTGHPTITASAQDRRTIARWVDFGNPIDFPTNDGFEYTKDFQLPIVTRVYPPTTPAEYANHHPVGFYDGDSGLNWGTLTVTYYAVAPPSTVVTMTINQADKVDAFDVLHIDYAAIAIPIGQDYVLKVSIEDNTGNKNEYHERMTKE